MGFAMGSGPGFVVRAASAVKQLASRGAGLLALLLAGCSTSPEAVPEAARPSNAAPGVVRLEFGWKPGLKAKVTSLRKRTRDAETLTRRELKSSFDLEVSAFEGELRVHTENFQVETSGDEAWTASQAPSLLAQLADLAPDSLISRRGEFSRVANMEAFREHFDRTVRELSAGAPESRLSGEVRKLLTSEAFLSARAQQEWNSIVGFWLGGELELGGEYSYSSEEPIAIFPGEKVLMHYSFSARRRLPCRREAKERDCVVLELVSRIDQGDAERLLAAVATKLGLSGARNAPIFRSLEIETFLRVVTEPDGLIPHSYNLTKTLRGNVSTAGEKQFLEQIDETDLLYAFD